MGKRGFLSLGGRKRVVDPEVRRFLDRLKVTVLGRGLVERGEAVLVAVSGGADSVALLRSLHLLSPELDLRLAVAHLNHGLRGDESDRDAAFVEAVARRLSVPSVLERLDPSDFPPSGRSTQDVAREKRYDFLRRQARCLGADKVALAHTADDQAETVLMRVLRGSGITGLGGIPWVREGIFVRPLLATKRHEIESFLETLGQPYVEDSSNLKRNYWRNRVRHELMPFLQEGYSPRLVDRLTGLSEIAAEEETAMEFLIRPVLAETLVQEEATLLLSTGSLVNWPRGARRRLIRGALRQLRGSLAGIESDHVEAVLSLWERGDSGRMVHLPGGVRVQNEFGDLRFHLGAVPGESVDYPLTVPGTTVIPELGLSVNSALDEGGEQAEPAEDGPAQASFDWRALDAPLRVRTRRPGDRIVLPTGMVKKLKKYLSERRIPLYRRDRLPLVVCGSRILWIPGVGRSAHAPVAPGTREIVVLRVQEQRE